MPSGPLADHLNQNVNHNLSFWYGILKKGINHGKWVAIERIDELSVHMKGSEDRKDALDMTQMMQSLPCTGHNAQMMQSLPRLCVHA